MEREQLCLLDREHWKAQRNFGPEKSNSEDYTITQLKLFRNDISVGVLHAFNGLILTGTGSDGANKLAGGLVFLNSPSGCLGLDCSEVNCKDGNQC